MKTSFSPLLLSLVISYFASQPAAFAGTGYEITPIRAAEDRPDQAFGVGLLTADSNGDHPFIAAGLVFNGTANEHASVRYETTGSVGWIQTTYFDSKAVYNDSDHAYSVVVQSDGKSVTGGFACASIGGALDCEFALTRRTTSGALDNSFGTGGRVKTSFAVKKGVSNALGLRIFLAGSKILVVGIQRAGTNALAIARYNSNGSLDPTFGSTGKILAECDLIPNSAAIQSDGRILLVGHSRDQARFSVARLTSSGTIDPSFAGTGVISENIGYRPDARAVSVQDNGKIVVIGQVGETNADVFVKRYLPNGSVDNSFGTSGYMQFDMGGQELPTAITTISDNDSSSDDAVVIASASYFAGVPNIVLAKLSPDGSLDSSFRSSGLSQPSIAVQSIPNDMKIQDNGKLIVVGSATRAGKKSPDFLAVRFNSDGSLDSSF